MRGWRVIFPMIRTASLIRTRAGGVHNRKVRIGGRPPEAFGTASIEFRNWFWESQSMVAWDLAHFELTAVAPVFAHLSSTDRVGQWRTKFGWKNEYVLKFTKTFWSMTFGFQNFINPFWLQWKANLERSANFNFQFAILYQSPSNNGYKMQKS